MRAYFPGLAVAGMLFATAGGTPAPAGACSGFGASCGCGPAVEVVTPCQPMIESYLVNQGPVFSGPGHYLHQLGDPDPCCYPSVGFVYSGYPYGAYGPGGYPRGFYSPYEPSLTLLRLSTVACTAIARGWLRPTTAEADISGAPASVAVPTI